MQFDQMKFRPVAFVLAETIFRETRAEVAHNRVARDLCDDARGRDGEAVAIAVDDRRLGQGKREYRPAVDEHVLRLKGKACDGDAHRLMGRAQNINRVYFERVDDSDSPRDGVVRHQIAINLFAFLRQKLLRIVQLFVPEFLRKNNRRRYNRTGKSAAPRFVNAGDGRDAEPAQLTLMPETTSPIHEGNSIRRLRRFSQIIFQESALICEICGWNYSRTAVASLPLRPRR